MSDPCLAIEQGGVHCHARQPSAAVTAQCDEAVLGRGPTSVPSVGSSHDGRNTRPKGLSGEVGAH